MAVSTHCVRCGATGTMSKAPEGGVPCWYCKGTGKRTWLLTQNSELRPFGIFNWTMPAFVVQLSNGKHFNVCPQAGVCASVCYARNGTYLFPSVKQSHTNKLEMTLHDPVGWEAVMLNEVNHPRYQGKWVRIHDSGDFYSEDYLRAWLRIASKTRGVRFYAYTKEVALFRRVVERDSTVKVLVRHRDGDPVLYAATDALGTSQYNDTDPERARRKLLVATGEPIPENFLYIYSMGGKQDHMLDREVDRHADIFPSEQTMAEAGYSSQEGDDTQCVTLPNIKIGIVENNIPHFKKVIAGRTFHQMQSERDEKRHARLTALAERDIEVPIEPGPGQTGLPIVTGDRDDRITSIPEVPAAGPDVTSKSDSPPARYKPQNQKPDLPTVPNDQGTLF